jgi:hypothetical protein
MQSPPVKQNGIVAIFDALGASSYSESEVESFMKSREKALNFLTEKIEGVLGFSADRVSIFTFNDTVIVILKCDEKGPNIEDVKKFFTILRKFLVDSMREKILFRGSISIGSFYANEEDNIVMGQAVTDAAAWYNKADWVGVNATPHATIKIQKLLEQQPENLDHLLIDYDIPLKDGRSLKLKAINWAKVFFVKGISPCVGNEGQRYKLLQFLSLHQVPLGTESKFHNTIAFFDYVVTKRKKSQVDSTKT